MNHGTPGTPGTKETWARWLGLNRATLAVLVTVFGLGLSEEIWKNFFGINLAQGTPDLLQAVKYVSVYAFFLNFAEGIGYIAGGTVAHRLGPRLALAASAIPMIAGFFLMLWTQAPWARVAGALLVTNWEPLSVPATFEVVGSELPENRRTIAFAVQSIQKRLPKVIGPLLGGVFFLYGFRVNLILALAVLVASVLVQSALLGKMRPKEETPSLPLKTLLDRIPPDIRTLLSAEILIRWGDWFVRDFSALYVVFILGRSPQEYGMLAALSAAVALATYIPVGKLADRLGDPRPLIGLTFFLFAMFPFCLVLLPGTGLPVGAALAIAFFVNGLREIGEPARKAWIATSFPADIRARAVGLYWGLRSFAFFPAPIASLLLWRWVGPDATFLVGGALGMMGTAWFFWRQRLSPPFCDKLAPCPKSRRPPDP